MATFASRLAAVLALAVLAAGSAFGQTGAERTAAALAKARDERLLLLLAAEFDPLAGRPDLPAELTWGPGDEAEVDYFIVQLRSKVVPSDHEELALLGAQGLEYLRHNAFLVRAPAAMVPFLEAWPRTRAIVPFEPAYRVAPRLLAAAAEAGRAPLDVAISLFEGADPASATLQMLSLGVDLPEPDAGTRRRLLARVPADRLVELARIRDVQWISPQITPELFNDTTAWVIQSNSSGSTTIWDEGIFGANVIVGHIDEALDLNSCFFDDPAVNNPGPTHRKVVSHRGSGSAGTHGCHTAGTVAGDQEPINGVTDDNGMAYHARIAHNNLNRITNTNLDSEMDLLFNDGARIFTNSWGSDSTTDYIEWCVDIDELSWLEPDVLVCFADSNSSIITVPANAKNCLAVGATQQAPNHFDHCTGGTGPTSDGRRKPEIYAPGCDIVSADVGNCTTAVLNGTSMATPAIAGAAALAKEYFEAGFWPSGVATTDDAFTPSGGLLKAVLIDAAVNMSGVSGYPSDLEGWGRLILDRALFFSGETRQLWLVDVPFFKGFDLTGETQTHYINVTGSSVSLEMCLCFMDKAGAINSSQPVVNDLDLEVLAPDGSLYLGNVFSGGTSATGGSPDPLNNVERVKLNSPVTGWYTVTIRATDIASTRKQGYAFVAFGDLEPPFEGGFEVYGSGTAGSGGFVPALSGKGSPTIGDDVKVELKNGLGGANALLLIGFARASIPFAGGEILVAPPWIVLPLQLGGTAGVAGAGSISLDATLPADPALVGAIIDLQGIVLDPAGTKGFALSNGLEMVIGS